MNQLNALSNRVEYDGFAQMLAKVVKRMPRLEPRPYAFRLFM